MADKGFQINLFNDKDLEKLATSNVITCYGRKLFISLSITTMSENMPSKRQQTLVFYFYFRKNIASYHNEIQTNELFEFQLIAQIKYVQTEIMNYRSI